MSYPTEGGSCEIRFGRPGGGRRPRGGAIAPAQATVVEKGRFSEFDFEPYRFAYGCGFRVEVTGRATTSSRLREGKNRSDSVFFSLDRIAFREVHTNPENGKWFSVRDHSLFNEVRARRVEGSIFELQTSRPASRSCSRTRRATWYSGTWAWCARRSSSTRRRRSARRARSIDVLDISMGGPHPRFTGDLCEIATPLIGS